MDRPAHAPLVGAADFQTATGFGALQTGTASPFFFLGRLVGFGKSQVGMGLCLSKMCFGMVTRHLRGRPSLFGGSSHTKVAATSG